MTKLRRYYLLMMIKKKQITLFLLGISLYLLFREKFNSLLANSNLCDWLSAENKFWPYVLGFWVLVLVTYYVWLIGSRVKSNWNWLYILSFIVVIYILEKFYFSYWIFLPKDICLSYMDIIFLVAILEIWALIFVNKDFIIRCLLHFRAWKRINRIKLKKIVRQLRETIFSRKQTASKRNVSIFQLERPLNEIDNDNLNRSEFVHRIAKEINQSFFQEAYSLGIVGKWGSGKSTFLNFLRKEIDKKGRVIIEFKPWLSQDAKSITKNFLTLFKSVLSKYDRNFKDSVNDYYKALTEVDAGIIGKTVNSVLSFLKKEKSLEDDFNQVNLLLEKLDRQVVIFIDDLDRLDYPEVIEVFKLIRNTANFRNTVFITAFDRAYITNAVKQFNDYNPQSYIDKIFDFEYVLPEFDQDFIIDDLNSLFSQEFEIDYSIPLNDDITHTIQLIISNQRDLRRFRALLFINNISSIKELLYEDYLLIELLRYKYPQIIAYIYKYRRRIFDIPIIVTPTSLYSLRQENDQLLLRDFLENNENSSNTRFNVSPAEIELIIDVFDYLFKENKSDGIFYRGEDDLKVKYNSIQKDGYFLAYFQLVLGEKAFRANEFVDKLIDDDFESFSDYLKETLNAYTSSKSIQIFALIKERIIEAIDSIDLHEKTIKTLLCIEQNGIPIPIPILIDLFTHQGNIADLYTEDNLKTKFIEIFEDNNDFSHHARSRILHNLIRNYIKVDVFSFLLSQEELEEVNFNIFNDLLASKETVDKSIFELYYKNYHNIDPDSDKVTINKKVNQRFREFIEEGNHCNSYFNFLPRPYMYPNIDKTFVFEPLILQVFESWDNFETLLDKATEYEHIDELQKYYALYKESGYSSFSLEEGETPHRDFIYMHEEL